MVDSRHWHPFGADNTIVVRFQVSDMFRPVSDLRQINRTGSNGRISQFFVLNCLSLPNTVGVGDESFEAANNDVLSLDVTHCQPQLDISI